MPFTTQPFLSRIFKGCLASIMLSAWHSVLALAPIAPTINRVDFSLVGFLVSTATGNVVTDANGVPVVDTSGDTQSYVVRWTDNSLDEEGFFIEARIAGGSFSTLSRVSANVREVFLSPLNKFPAGTVVDFRVTAWKLNGTISERASSPIFSFKIPENSITLSTPTNFASTHVNDSTLKLTWTDTSTSELYYQVLYREVKTPEISYSHLGFTNFFGNLVTNSPAEQTLRHRLVPGVSYDFKVRGTRQAPSGSTPAVSPVSGDSNKITVTIPALTPPSHLSATSLREDLVRLQWRDNSTNETGYEIQYRPMSDPDPEAFTVYGTTAENSTSTTISLPQNLDVEWRVAAVYTYTISGASTTSTVKSLPSDRVTTSTTFPAPVLLTATTSPGVANTVDLTWEDKSNSEGGFNIYTRPQGTSTFFFARAVRPGVTKVSVNSRTESNDSDGRPVFTTLATGVVHEFVVRSVSADETVFSLDSNTLTASVKDGFTSRLYQPAQKGVSFLYQATTSNSSQRLSWNATPLPNGLQFDSQAGQIVGTPTESGVFNVALTATFPNAVLATATLVLRVLPGSSAPERVNLFSNMTVGLNAPINLPLSDKFKDEDSEMAVSLDTTKGTLNLLLYPSLAPRAVSNFMAYVNAGDYNGLAFHRLVQGFVLQGGSLRPVNAPKTFVSIPGRPPVANEPGISHVRGTVAAAKVGARSSTATLANNSKETRDDRYGYVGDPDSATTDFFFNLQNNSGNLDNQNGGFTAFGRLGTPSLFIMDTIASLPPGDYLNNNTTNTYNASLDKRLIVDGAAAAFNDVPMDAGSAPADMDINKTVRVKKISTIPVLNYVVTAVPAGIVTAVVTGNDLRLTGIKEGSTVVTVIASDLDNRTNSQEFAVTVSKLHRAPAITRHPVALTVLAGARATFTAAATGTNIVYRWRKDGEVIAGQTGPGSPTFIIPATQIDHTGLYDVQVSNATTTLTSNRVRLDIRTAPTITQALVPKWVEVGKPLLLQSSATGAPPPTFLWKRGTVAVASKTLPVLPDGTVQSSVSIPAAKLTDAGLYSVTATNAANKATSNSVSICVVDKTAQTRVVTPNTLITLTAAANGPAGTLTYRWLRDGTEIPLNTSRYSGLESPTLKITGAQFGDSGQYSCRVSLPDELGDVETGPIKVAVVIRPEVPALTDENAPPTAFIGVNYSWALPYSKNITNTPTSFSISGLPTGLTYSTSTGIVSGRPTRVGVFTISATASNVAGASTPAKTAKITVAPLPAPTVGTLVGTVRASEQLNGNLGGRLDLTVMDTGSYSAKLILGKTTYNAAGSLGVGSGLFDINSLSYQSRISIPRTAGLAPLTLAFEIDSDGGYVSGVVSDGSSSALISGIRQFWDATLRPSFFYSMSQLTQSFNLGLNLSNDDIGKAAIPQGSGYLTMSVTSAGRVNVTGRLADGTTVTGSSILGPAGEAIIFQTLYSNTGSILGGLDIGDNYLNYQGNARLRVDGQVRWFKAPAATTSTDRTYAAGIAETFLSVLGGNYQSPGTNKIVMDLPNTATPLPAVDNVSLDFSEGGLSSSTTNPDLSFRLTTTNTAVYPASNATAAKVAFAVTTSTGAFTGSFALADGRKVTYQGLLIPALPQLVVNSTSGSSTVTSEIPASGAHGVGYFTLPELLPSLTKSKINSGRVLLSPIQLQITTQPQAQTVNPGANVTFSVSATGQGTISYRWRKNGVTISGATTNTLNLNAVTEDAQASYDCVVSNGPSVVASNAAALSVNDPVSAVTASRTPSGSVIATGQQVTFSVSAQGTGLTYQWRKNSANINGATSSTYVIASTTLDDSANYDVVVKNSVTTGGVSSNNVGLTVASPVTIQNVTRNPADGSIAAGTPITFSVDASGTGTLTYQWRKDGSNITGATAASYTIDNASVADSGSYDVVIKNVVSTAGVTSSAISLTVDP